MVMVGATAAELLQAAGAIALLALGAVMALVSANAVKRVAGVALALLGALLGAAAINAPPALALGAIGAAFAHLIIGAAIVVRLQEAYGGVETRAFDEADEAAEPPEPSA
jgi:multisubunit Na+/H+ antiporter MnhG subunit